MKIKFVQRDYNNHKEYCGLRIWVKPKDGHTYAIGVDVAEGVGKDASCAQVIDCKTGVVVANFWSNLIDVDNYAAELYKLGMFYNKATLCIESNNHGHAVIALMGGAPGGLTYPNLYKRVVFDEYTQKRTKQIGFKTTTSTKPRIIENLKSALRDGELQVYDKLTILELTNFTRDERTGRMAASGNAADDRVMSLALAWEQARQIRENMQMTSELQEKPMRYDAMTGFPIL